MSDSKKLNALSAASYLIGDVIGSGIFVSPTGILQNCGSVGLSLIIWALCGVLSLLGTLCYVELGTSIPRSGGDFAYLCFYEWQPLAFAFLWTYLLIYRPCNLAVLGKTFGSYVVQSLDPILNFSDYSKDVAEKLFGITLILLLMWVNFFQLTKYASKFTVVVTAFKILSLAVIIITGAVYMIQGNVSNFDNPMEGSVWSINLTLALYSGLWSYNGFESLNFGIEELNDPKRTLIVAAISGMVIVTFLYLATNVAYFAVLGTSGLLDSSTVAETFAQKLLGNFSYAVPLVIGIVIMGSLNSSFFTSSRYFYAAARQGQLPSFMKLMQINQNTPQPTLFVFALLGIIMINVDNVQTLINCSNFVVWFQRVFTISGLLWIRFRKWPVKDGAVKIPIVIHVIFLICAVFLVIVETYTLWQLTLIGYAVALFGLLVYFALIRPRNSPRILHVFDAQLMKLCQIIFYAMPQTEVLFAEISNKPEVLIEEKRIILQRF